jgi:hypothetical protein
MVIHPTFKLYVLNTRWNSNSAGGKRKQSRDEGVKNGGDQQAAGKLREGQTGGGEEQMGHSTSHAVVKGRVGLLALDAKHHNKARDSRR